MRDGTDPDPDQKTPHFDGDTYDPALDHGRLNTQLQAVKHLMSDGEWRTLDEIAFIVPATLPSISARLRDLRKEKFGGWKVERRRTFEPGVFEYRLVVN